MTQVETPRLNFDEALERVNFYAETVGVSPPCRLLGDDGVPSTELSAFCLTYGASLDWIFLGDLRGMIRNSYRWATSDKHSDAA
ncbi:hypothetical protein [uncultured Roseovarius sp.]|uniref:hypothetical protein n=1 Tax=uncultured Roseovarius sp. TaxID=293344 RepID=UPI0026214142|nr:hypothetical protein [uncultured Roseovarius sp.]